MRCRPSHVSSGYSEHRPTNSLCSHSPTLSSWRFSLLLPPRSIHSRIGLIICSSIHTFLIYSFYHSFRSIQRQFFPILIGNLSLISKHPSDSLYPSIQSARQPVMASTLASTSTLDKNPNPSSSSSSPSRVDTQLLKTQLASVLGDNGRRYWAALLDFCTAKINRQEFHSVAEHSLHPDHRTYIKT